MIIPRVSRFSQGPETLATHEELSHWQLNKAVQSNNIDALNLDCLHLKKATHLLLCLKRRI